MPIPLETLVKQLTESSIIAAGKLENFVPPKAHPKDGDELIRELVKQNQLTKFQAAQIAAGKAKALILGNYTLLDKIGAGGMGQVFKAVHRRMERTVALKMLPPAMTKDPAALARFQREVKAAAKLRHTNIVAADDADEANGIHFLVMEYVEGCDLSLLVKKNGPLPVNRAVNYILQAARGLEFAHSKGVIHRDIKPANLLLSNDGVVKILDMGLARIDQADGAAAQSDLTGTGTVMGTVDYMAPEQALNTKHADQRADIYSLGISLYYLLSGKAAYSGDTVMEKLLAHREAPIPSLQEVQTTVPKPLQAIFEKMVAKRADDRYQSMTEVIEGLESLGLTGSKSNSGEGASTLSLSEAERKRLAGTKSATAPLSALTKVVASEKSRNFLAKVIGGTFVTIIAPILVTYLIKYLERDDAPPPAAQPPAAQLPANATVATNSPLPTAGEGPGVRGSSVSGVSSLSPQPSPVKGGGVKAWQTPEFQKWVADTQKLPATEQLKAVSKKLQELNPGFDGQLFNRGLHQEAGTVKGVVTEVGLKTVGVKDISPLRVLSRLMNLNLGAGTLADLAPLQGLNLEVLVCSSAGVSSLEPLRGMPLTSLNVDGTQVADLEPLRGMKLTELRMTGTPVSNLSPLTGMPLETLWCDRTEVSDLSPLAGMSLKKLIAHNSKISDLTPLRQCKSLELLDLRGVKVSAASVEALQQAVPNCKISWENPKGPPAASKNAEQSSKPWETPAFQKWVADTQKLPAEQRVDAVRKKLIELNPGYDGRIVGAYGTGDTPVIKNGVLMEAGISSDDVTDISPLQALQSTGWLYLVAPGRKPVQPDPTFLEPLRGLPLLQLNCQGNKRVCDLSALHESPNLKAVRAKKTSITAEQVAALQAVLPNCTIDWDGPKQGASPTVATALDAALKFDGEGYVDIPAMPFDANSPFTWEVYVTQPQVKSSGKAGVVLGVGSKSKSFSDFDKGIEPGQSLSFLRTSSGQWRWKYSKEGEKDGAAIAGAPVRAERTHLACVHEGQTYRLYIDGQLFKSTDYDDPHKSDGLFQIGPRFVGIIDEVRISKVARYKEDFTPQARFATDADTLGLYHFDEGAGSELKDSSGNNRHGKITGAVWVRADGSALPAR